MILPIASKFVFNRLFLYQSLASLSTYLTIKLVFFFSRRAKRYALLREYGIPMEETSIIHGHAHIYRSNPARFATDEQFMKKYGKVYGYFLVDEPCIVVTDVDILKKIFLDKSHAFRERCAIRVQTSLDEGILFARHDRWKALRSIMSPYFSSFFVRSDSSAEFIEASIKQLIDYIESKHKEAAKENRSAVIDVHKLMKSATLQMISAVAVQLPNVQIREDETNVKSLDRYMTSSDSKIARIAFTFPFLTKILVFLSGRESILNSIHRTFDKLIVDKVGSLQKSGQGKYSHLIDQLIKSYHQGNLTRRELIGSIDSLLVAGYDTTSTALTYLFWVVGKNPHIQDKLRQELGAYGTDSDYLLQVINETLRLYPPVISFTTRLATETFDLGHLVIPKGAKVVYNAYLMHRHPDLWDQPDNFDPDRFAKDKVIHPCAFAPFGLGDRKCIGFQLSLLEMRMIVCDLVLRYRIKTLAPDVLKQKSHAFSLSEPNERVEVEFIKI